MFHLPSTQWVIEWLTGGGLPFLIPFFKTWPWWLFPKPWRHECLFGLQQGFGSIQVSCAALHQSHFHILQLSIHLHIFQLISHLLQVAQFFFSPIAFCGLIAGPFEASNCFADHLEHLPEFGVFFFFCHLGRLFQFLLPLLICFFCFGFFLFFQFFFLLPFGFLVKFFLLFLIDRPLTWWPSWALESGHFSFNRKWRVGFFSSTSLACSLVESWLSVAGMASSTWNVLWGLFPDRRPAAICCLWSTDSLVCCLISARTH